MAVRKILIYPQDEARLRRKSAEVKRMDAETRSLIRDLKDTLAHEPGGGLAAPQIGIYKRVALVVCGQDTGNIQPPKVIINPVILERGPTARSFDGCLSIPDLYTWDAPRPSWLVFTARDEQFNKFKLRVEGIDAVVVAHEVDHLDGVLFLDHLDREAKLFHRRVDENGEATYVPVRNRIAT